VQAAAPAPPEMSRARREGAQRGFFLRPVRSGVALAAPWQESH
jgi:hypothetical protein